MEALSGARESYLDRLLHKLFVFCKFGPRVWPQATKKGKGTRQSSWHLPYTYASNLREASSQVSSNALLLRVGQTPVLSFCVASIPYISSQLKFVPSHGRSRGQRCQTVLTGKSLF